MLLAMRLKVATYNIHFGIEIDTVAQNLKELAADGVGLFCLQEVWHFDPDPSHADILQEALGEAWQHDIFMKPNSHDLGVCIFWRRDLLTLQSIEKIWLPKLPRFNFYEALIEKSLGNVIKAPMHKGALIATFAFGGKLLRVTDLHLDWHGHFVHRAEQLRYVLAHLSAVPADCDIIAGDFNTMGPEILFGNQERKIRNLLGPRFTNVFSRFVPTSRRILQRLDYIFVRNLKILNAEVLRCAGSDHFPVVATFEMDQNNPRM
jgi:endonuclease/exonuclease/phosphatase family metal-dependent hydrolase